MSGADHDVLAELPRNDREVIRVAVSSFRGYRYADIRLWYRLTTDDDYRPGKGATVRPEMIPAVVDALNRADALLNGR